MVSPSDEAQERLASFLEQFGEKALNDSVRCRCKTCGDNRAMYCSECCRILVPHVRWPKPIRDGSLKLPFDLDIVLDDRRASATGVQLMSVVKSTLSQCEMHDDGEHGDKPNVRLFDIEKNDPLPEYTNDVDSGTFLLFPSRDSKPLSSVASSVERLVVLDCTWTRSSIRLDPSIASLQKVHLDHVPTDSYFWRWHAAGEGMLCTAEAIYYAAWNVASLDESWSNQDRDNLVYFLYLFGLQRGVINQRYKRGEVKCFKQVPRAPFLKETKEFQRTLRQRERPKIVSIPK